MRSIMINFWHSILGKKKKNLHKNAFRRGLDLHVSHTTGEFRGRLLSLHSPVHLVQTLVCNIDNACHQDLPEDTMYPYAGAR